MNYARLGRLAKAAAEPGEYDDYTDEELGEDLAEEGYTEANFENSLVLRGSTALTVPTVSPAMESELLEAIQVIYEKVENKALKYSEDSVLFPKWKANAALKQAMKIQARTQELTAFWEWQRPSRKYKPKRKPR